MLDALEALTAVVVGLMVGVEFAVAFVMPPIFNALPEDSGQLARAHGGRMLGAVMPFWYIGSLVLVGICAFAGWNADDLDAGLLVAAGALLIVSVAMSILLLVPINNLSKRWTPENRPADWKQQSRRWERLHYVRVAVIIAAFTLLVVALV